MHYSTSVPNVASEIFDGEVVVANYLTGAYYSLTGSASTIWQGLHGGMSVTEIVDWLGARFPDAAADIGPAVAGFIGRMVDEGMVAPAAAPGGEPAPPALALAVFEPPQVERFDDLADLLTLDPVHDVAEAGWPHLPGREV